MAGTTSNRAGHPKATPSSSPLASPITTCGASTPTAPISAGSPPHLATTRAPPRPPPPAGPGDNESASWAPNGRHLIFQSSRQGGTQLYTMLADGSEQQVLTAGPGQASSPAWSPRLP